VGCVGSVKSPARDGGPVSVVVPLLSFQAATLRTRDLARDVDPHLPLGMPKARAVE